MKIISMILLLAAVVISCTPKHEKLKQQISDLEKKISQQTMIDKADGAKLLALYTDFAESFPEDTATHIVLYNAARLAVAIDEPNKAITLLEQLVEGYPDSELVPEALIFAGFIYETVIMDIDKARVWYQQFINDFPSHPMVEDIKITILNLGKTPEELAEEYISNLNDTIAIDNGSGKN